MKFGIWTSLYLLGEAERGWFRCLPGSLLHYTIWVAHQGEPRQQRSDFRHYRALRGSPAQLSRNSGLLVVYFPLSESQTLRVAAGLTGKVLPNKCISLHLQMKPQNEVNFEKQQQQITFVIFFFFNLSALLLACPLPLWPPVPSISF